MHSACAIVTHFLAAFLSGEPTKVEINVLIRSMGPISEEDMVKVYDFSAVGLRTTSKWKYIQNIPNVPCILLIVLKRYSQKHNQSKNINAVTCCFVYYDNKETKQ